MRVSDLHVMPIFYGAAPLRGCVVHYTTRTYGAPAGIKQGSFGFIFVFHFFVPHTLQYYKDTVKPLSMIDSLVIVIQNLQLRKRYTRQT